MRNDPQCCVVPGRILRWRSIPWLYSGEMIPFGIIATLLSWQSQQTDTIKQQWRSYVPDHTPPHVCRLDSQLSKDFMRERAIDKTHLMTGVMISITAVHEDKVPAWIEQCVTDLDSLDTRIYLATAIEVFRDNPPDWLVEVEIRGKLVLRIPWPKSHSKFKIERVGVEAQQDSGALKAVAVDPEHCWYAQCRPPWAMLLVPAQEPTSKESLPVQPERVEQLTMDRIPVTTRGCAWKPNEALPDWCGPLMFQQGEGEQRQLSEHLKRELRRIKHDKNKHVFEHNEF